VTANRCKDTHEHWVALPKATAVIDETSAAGADSLDWIYIAKGIGIFLVVIGHFSAYPAPSPSYWSAATHLIYTFHMPLFFMLSGYLYHHDKYSYLEFIKGKTKRLLYPFVSIALIFLSVKLLAGAYANLEHPVELSGVYALLTNPINSFVPLLWFVHALFLVFAMYPLARMVSNNAVLLIVLVALDAVFAAASLPFVGNALAYGPFFIYGVMLQQKRFSRFSIGLAPTLVASSIFLSIYFASTVQELLPENSYVVRFCLGVLGSVVVINGSQRLVAFGNMPVVKALIALGYYSMGIYLFHTLFESAVRVGFFQVLKDDLPFEFVACVAIASGLVFPLMLEKHVLRRISLTRRLILGLA
jgi:fucose 4-O-acetylase-like acetyltransferase